MASKDRVPPQFRRPLPGPGVMHPDPYASAIRPPHGALPSFEMLPPHEVMAKKLSAQHVEIEKLVTENRRLASTHGTLRQDLATAKHDLQLVHAHISEMKSENERQMRAIVERMSAMESELEAAGSVKVELQKARGEAQSLLAARQELISKVQQLTRDLQMAHSDAQQIPSLMAELDNLRQEYQHCRATYDYEKKLYNDHLESLQVMEKNYMAMSREVEKLRAELTNSANFDPRTGGPYSGSAGYNEGVPAGNYAYGIGQGQAIIGGVSGGGPAAIAGTGGNSPHVVAQSGPYGPGSRGPVYGYDPHRGPAGAGHDAQRVQTGPTYDAQRAPAPSGPGYEAQKGPGYEAQRTPGYDARNGPGYDGQSAPPTYDSQRGSGNEVQRGANYDTQKGTSYDAKGTVAPQGQVPVSNNNNAPYGSTPSTRGGNPVRR